MALNCPTVVSRIDCDDVNPCRIKGTRLEQPIVIVVHLIQGELDSYDSFLRSPCTHFKCQDTPNCTDLVPTTNPKSVHFMITPTAIVQYADLDKVTIGLDYLYQPSWPDYGQLGVDINEKIIHIGINTTEVANNLITLLCCIGVELGVSLPVITAYDLNTERPFFSLSPTIKELADNCITSGGVDLNIPSISDIIEDIEFLEQCCYNNSSDIVVLKNQVQSLNTSVAQLNTRVTKNEEDILKLYEITAIIPTLQEQIVILINQVNDILTRCCPKPPESVCFQYQLLPDDQMLITPNQPVWLNLPTKITDTNPPVVIPGPLWTAKLCDCTWKLEATVRFRLSEWCKGKKASLYLIACGQKYLIAEQEIVAQGKQQVTLNGEWLLPNCCNDVHLLVATNDSTTSAKIVEFADFKGCCA